MPFRIKKRCRFAGHLTFNQVLIANIIGTVNPWPVGAVLVVPTRARSSQAVRVASSAMHTHTRTHTSTHATDWLGGRFRHVSLGSGLVTRVTGRVALAALCMFVCVLTCVTDSASFHTIQRKWTGELNTLHSWHISLVYGDWCQAPQANWLHI